MKIVGIATTFLLGASLTTSLSLRSAKSSKDAISRRGGEAGAKVLYAPLSEHFDEGLLNYLEKRRGGGGGSGGGGSGGGGGGGGRSGGSSSSGSSGSSSGGGRSGSTGSARYAKLAPESLASELTENAVLRHQEALATEEVDTTGVVPHQPIDLEDVRQLAFCRLLWVEQRLESSPDSGYTAPTGITTITLTTSATDPNPTTRTRAYR